MSVYRMEVSEAPVRILRPSTVQLIATRLDSRKVLLTPNGIHRDWRGLAEQAQLDVNTISSGRISATEHCFHLWGKQGTIGQLWSYLEAMDRYDVIDDTLSKIYDNYDMSQSQVGGLMTVVPPPIDHSASSNPDIITTDDQRNLNCGLGLQHYNALVLSADEDCDFVQKLIEKMEGEYGLKLCLKDRDLIGGLQFETDSIVKLILERCSYVIVVLSVHFLQSSVNTFFTSFAHALSVEKRQRIVIPCRVAKCDTPSIIRFCHSLDFYRAHTYWDYWEKLKNSIMTEHLGSQSHSRIEAPTRARVSELPSSIEATTQARIIEVPPQIQSQPTQAKMIELAPQSPKTSSSPSLASSSPRSFFSLSRLFAKGNSIGKLKLSSSSESPSHQVTKKRTSSEGSTQQDKGQNAVTNGHTYSSAIPIHKSSKNNNNHNSVSSASGESSDLFVDVLDTLPDVPETPPLSPDSITNSNAFLIPVNVTPSPKSSSKFSFDKLFKVKHKRKDYG